MQVIVPQTNAAKALFIEAKPEAGACRLSKYVLRVPCKDGVLLYHMMTGELLLLSQEEANAERDEALRAQLQKRRFLVPSDFDDCTFLQQFRTVAALLSRKPAHFKSFTVFTTMDCNARCPYCYELGRPRVPMSDQTAHDTAAFIARVSGGEAVKLCWFGGEPLYNRRAIEIITGELRAKGIPYRSSMVTNGYLFDEETVRTAKTDWALERVQITLDGTEENYNRIKGFADAEGSAFVRVLDNIERLLRADVRVMIRLNASLENMDDLCRLADVLKVRFQGEKKLRVYSALLRDYSGAGTHPEAEADALRKWDALQRLLIDCGIGGAKPLDRQLHTNNCMADSDGSVTVLPDGRLGKCEHESERLFVGSIYEGITDPETVAKWKERVQVPACRDCEFAPGCIRLRLCSWTDDDCTEADREHMRLTMTQRILCEYSRYLRKNPEAYADDADDSEYGH